MAKRLTAKTGEYQKDGQTKGRYTDLGVILSNNNGEYMLLDPTVNLAGVLVKQNAMARAAGQQERDSVMVSIFENDRGNQGGGYGGGQQQNNRGNDQGYSNQSGYGAGGRPGGNDLEDSIPFSACVVI